METNLIQVKENEVVTTSLMIAEKFNKNHSHILRSIGSLISQMEDNPKLVCPNFFEKSVYVNAQNKTLPMYYIGRDGFTLLVMGFTGKEALEWKLKYIEAFNEMEKRIHSPALEDGRLEIARLILDTPDKKLPLIRALYPEYFSKEPTPGSLEYIADRYSSYREWLDTFEINASDIMARPSKSIYQNYLIYCENNDLPSMGKKTFYKTVEDDFQFTKKQKSDGERYFVYA